MALGPRRPETYNGPVPYGQPLQQLVETLRTGPPSKRWNAVFALADHSDPTCLGVLRCLFESPDIDLRSAIVFIIGEHANGQTERGVVLDALNDESELVVRTACEVVSKLRLQEANKCLISLLDGSPAVQHAALNALGHVWLPINFQAAFWVYRHPPNDDNRKTAASILYENADSKSWSELFECFRSDDPPRHRTWACELAGVFGDMDIAHEIQTLCFDTDGHVRKAASRALAKVNGLEEEDK
jgi:HEAT repeat protein